MKKIILIVTILLFKGSVIFAQAPQAFQYQAVMRDIAGNVIVNQSVSFQISLISGSSSGTVEYIENHFSQTSDLGIVNLSIGNGSPILGSFNSINWGNNIYFIKIEADTTGGTNYFDFGTFQLLSVPYALYADKSGSSADTLWTLNGNNIYNTNNGNVGIGISSPPGKLVVKGDSLSLPTDPLFEIKGRNGQTVMVVYEDSVHFFIKDDGAKANRGGFAVSGRNNAKALTNDFLFVNADSTRIYTTDPDAGFGVRNIGLTNKTSYLHLIPDNYFIGHESGQKVTIGTGNTFFGYQSGFSDTSGSENVFIGQYSGYSNITGINNIFIGNASGYSTTNGNYNICLGNNTGNMLGLAESNVFIGDGAGYSSTTGSYNTFIGDMAGSFNTIGLNNIFIGTNSGSSNISGKYNICLGNESGFSLDTAESNVFIGDQAGYSNSFGNYNTFIGESSGYANTTGKYNVFIGALAGNSNTTGSYNICLGNDAGMSLDTATSNVFIGTEAGYSNAFGNENTFIGDQAGATNTSGDRNVFLGNLTGYMNESGDGNVFIGSQAGELNTFGHYNIFIGEGSGNSNLGDIADSSLGSGNIFLGETSGFTNSVGYDNVFIGTSSGYSNIDGTDNYYIGRQAGENNNGSYNVFIGAESGRLLTTENSRLWIDSRDVTVIEPPLIYGEFDNRNVVIDGDATSNINNRTFFVNGSAGGTGAWFNDSDRRLKKNVTNIPDALSKTLKLQGVNYEWIDNEKHGKGKQIGFIAQDAEKVIPEVVCRSNDHYSMSYAPITALLVEAIKEQQKMIEDQKNEIELLKLKYDNDLNLLKAQVDIIKKNMNAKNEELSNK